MIKDFPIDRYKFHIDPEAKVVVAISTYAGKTCRGIARCSENDTFDVEYGKRLAAARCNAVVSTKRLARASALKTAMKEILDEVYDDYADILNYASDATQRLDVALNELDSILNEG